MKIAVLGATGPTGQQVVQRALDNGHFVMALVRNPDKMKIKHENLQVEVVDIFSTDSMVLHLEGCDAVISCLGAHESYWSAVTLLSESIIPIAGALRAAGVKKYICMSSWCSVNDSSHPKIMEWLIKPLFLKRALKDMAAMEFFLANECPDLDYVVVRPPGLSDGKYIEKEVLAVDGQFVKDAGWQIPRANVAHFMLECASSETWNKKMVAVGI